MQKMSNAFEAKQQNVELNFKITQAAESYIKRTLNANYIVRLQILAGGCKDFQCDFDIVSIEDTKEDFILFDSKKEALLAMDVNSFKIVNNGFSIDYKDSIMNKGLVLVPPDPKARCSCGSSFFI